MTRRAGNDLPRVAVIYDHEALDLLAFARAGRGRWRTIWVIDTQLSKTQRRILGRFGELVDAANASLTHTVQELRRHSADAIVALIDSQLSRAAAIAEELGLRFHSRSTVTKLVDKRAQRAALRAAGLAAPRLHALRIDRPVSSVELPTQLDYPLVVKPRRGAGSRDTYRADEPASLRRALAVIAERATGPPAELVAEEYLPDGWARDARPYADFVSVESIAAQGTFSCLAVSGKLPLAEPFRETGDFIESPLDQATHAEVIALAHHAAAALGVTDSALHTEIKLTPDGPRVIEVNGRIGGDVEQNLRQATGSSIYRAAVEASLGTFTPVAGPLPTVGVAFDYDMQPPTWATRVEKVAGIEACARLDGVISTAVRHPPGQRMDWRDGTAGRVMSFRGLVSDHGRMFELIDEIDATMEITYG